jgi:hypothetical protein
MQSGSCVHDVFSNGQTGKKQRTPKAGPGTSPSLLTVARLNSLCILGGANYAFTQRCISSLFLTAVLAAPVAMLASPAPKDDGVQVRVYDSHHEDYHNWDDHENNAWGIYLTNNHKKNHEFSFPTNREICFLLKANHNEVKMLDSCTVRARARPLPINRYAPPAALKLPF